jgi:hypothetical protein
MKRNKVFQFLASLKLAVVLFVLFAIILALATYYESTYDTQTAQHLVYKSPLFAGFLALFFLNIFCSTAIRFPWKRKQVGFVITHAGILTLLLAAALTMGWGIDGSMMVQEGQSSNRILLNDPVFFVGKPSEPMQEIPAEFRWTAPSAERPARVALREGVTAEVLQYLHHAKLNTYYVAGKPGVAALQLRLHNERVDQRQWLTVGKGDLELGPASVQLLRASDEAHLQRLLGGRTDQGELQLLVQGNPHQLKVSELVPGKPVTAGPALVELRRYLPHAVVENGELISRSKDPVNPCVDVRVSDAEGNYQDWLLFARMPQLNTRTGSKGELPVKVTYVSEARGPKQHMLTLVVTKDGKLWSKVDQQKARPVTVGKAQATGWMNLQFEVSEFIPQAREVREFSAVEVDKAEQQNAPPPAIQVRFAGAKEPGPFWLERGDVQQIETTEGKPLVVGYAYRSQPLDFDLHLKDFQIDFDPGTTTAAAFKSLVEVDGKQHTIQMNEPLVKNGYKLFQSSYSEIPGQPTISIFTVAHDPGIALKYLGSIMMTVGIAIMFWMKPYGGGAANRGKTDRAQPSLD